LLSTFVLGQRNHLAHEMTGGPADEPAFGIAAQHEGRSGEYAAHNRQGSFVLNRSLCYIVPEMKVWTARFRARE
jgi:hypothetical protein